MLSWCHIAVEGRAVASGAAAKVRHLLTQVHMFSPAAQY